MRSHSHHGVPVCVQEVGYQHGRTVFDIWGRSGVLEKMLQDRQGTSKMKACDVSARAGGHSPAETRPLVPSPHPVAPGTPTQPLRRAGAPCPSQGPEGRGLF